MCIVNVLSEVTCLSVDECDPGPPVDIAELRRQVALMPSIDEISARLKAVLAHPTTWLPTESAVFSPTSVCSHGLSQIDSGFASPPYDIADDDEDDDADISGVEAFEADDDFQDILGDGPAAALSVSRPDGKSHGRLYACACLMNHDRCLIVISLR